MLPQLVRQGAKLLRAPEFCRPAATWVQDCVTPLGSPGSFFSLELVGLTDLNRKLEIVWVIGDRNPERRPDQRQVLPDYMRSIGDWNRFMKEKTAGRLAQRVAGKAINTSRARQARNCC